MASGISLASMAARHLLCACRSPHGASLAARRHFAEASPAAGHLPPHAVELTGTSASSASSSSQAEPATALKAAPWERLTILPVLHGLHGKHGAEDVAEAIRARAPRQVFVELCTKRYSEVLSSAVLGFPARPPPRVDILGNIHGGLLGFELIPVLKAAREVGAAVVPVDRARAATRNRVGQKLLSPRFMQGLLRYGIYSLQRRRTARFADSETLRHEFRASCPGAYEVLVAERSSYMAHQLRAAAVPGADIFLACSVLHTAEIVQALRREPQLPSSAGVATTEPDLLELGRRGMPVWPVLMVGYIVIPSMVGLYIASAFWSRFLSPVLDMPE
jgi:pheromone shutdown protein TraB